MNTELTKITWKPIWLRDSNDKRRLDYYEAYPREGRMDNGYLRIRPEGGYITVKTYWLTYRIWRGDSEPKLAVYFHTLKAAQDWAKQFVNGGALITPGMIRPLY